MSFLSNYHTWKATVKQSMFWKRRVCTVYTKTSIRTPSVSLQSCRPVIPNLAVWCHAASVAVCLSPQPRSNCLGWNANTRGGLVREGWEEGDCIFNGGARKRQRCIGS